MKLLTIIMLIGLTTSCGTINGQSFGQRFGKALQQVGNSARRTCETIWVDGERHRVCRRYRQ